MARRSGRNRYFAFVFDRAKGPRFVDLGDALDIDAAVSKARQAVRAVQFAETSLRLRDLHRESQDALRELHRRIWRPLEGMLPGINAVVIGPDGQLNLAPFAALVDAKGRSLIERYRISYVTTGRDLLRPRPQDNPNLELLLLADPPSTNGAPCRPRLPADPAASPWEDLKRCREPRGRRPKCRGSFPAVHRPSAS